MREGAKGGGGRGGGAGGGGRGGGGGVGEEKGGGVRAVGVTVKAARVEAAMVGGMEAEAKRKTQIDSPPPARSPGRIRMHRPKTQAWVEGRSS